MTAQVLTTELSNLISESKRKNAELRTAAEKSLEDLKALHVTSETQLAADLRQRPTFISPFLLACPTRNAKLVGTAINCLQRLIVSRCIAAQSLKEVLGALSEATSQGFDVQLRILQALPSLFHNYADDLSGPLLATALSICSTLLGSKTAAVNSTAAATLQQLVVSVFDKVVSEDREETEAKPTEDIHLEDGDISLPPAASDAYKVFNDICLLTQSQKPQFIQFAAVRQTFGLELIESVLTNHAKLFLSHPEQADILRSRVMPFVITSLSARPNFATTVRVMRVLYILLRQHLDVLTDECEAALDGLIRALDPEIAPIWKRVMCMEVFRGIYAEPGLIRRIYHLFDEQEGKRNIVREQVAALVRLASERPSVIGLGQQSSVPGGSNATSSSEKQAGFEAGGVVGMMGAATTASDGSTPGISVHTSSVRVPCIDHLDKAEPPVLPESYIYSLVLNCINALSEGLAKFVMPLTIPPDSRGKGRNRVGTVSEQDDAVTPPKSIPTPPGAAEKGGRRMGRKAQIPLNPLQSTQHSQFGEIKTSAALIEECWPALLATCSTFLQAALDDEYYHDLIRSIQKLTQVSGLLRLSTPRDAFLTLLGKSAVPANVVSAFAALSPTTPSAEPQSMFASAKGLLSPDKVVGSPTSQSEKRFTAPEPATTTLSTRNLLSLRALLNLGIALGPTLEEAWSIILEAVQQADFILYISSKRMAKQGAEGQTGSEGISWHHSLASEIRAVETATSRLLDCTSDFPNDAFVDILRAMCNLLGVVKADAGDGSIRTPPQTPPRLQAHRRASSISPISTASAPRIREDQFVIAKLGELARTNMFRFICFSPSESGWTILAGELVGISCSGHVNAAVRLKAGEVLTRIVVEAMMATASEAEEARGPIQERFLSALQSQAESSREGPARAGGAESEGHRLALEAMKSILEQCGEALVAGWNIIFRIVGSAFGEQSRTTAGDQLARTPSLPLKSPRLVRSAFGSLQLICSDFLSSLPRSCVLILVDTLYRFCFQDDLNISLTTITFFWNVSDFLQHKVGTGCLTDRACTAQDEKTLVGVAESDVEEDACAALWLLLLLRLTAVTTDHRLEVRNGAVHTLLRIFDAHGDQLRPEGWRSCLRVVMFKMVDQNKALWTGLDMDGHKEAENEPWDETTVLVLSGVAGLFADYLDVLIQQEDFQSSWQTLMGYFDYLLSIKRTSVDTAVYESLRRILVRMETAEKVGPDALDQVWRLWSKGIPVEESHGSFSKGRYQDVLSAYILLFREIYRLTQPSFDEARMVEALGRIYDCTCFPDKPAYSSDVDNLTPFQTHVLETLAVIETNVPGVLFALVSRVSTVVTLPFSHSSEEPDQKTLSYVALSTSSMNLLERLVLQNISSPKLYTSGALASALEALALPISLKYAFSHPSQGSQLFRPATTIAVTILTSALSSIPDLPAIGDHALQRIWKRIVLITNAVTSARPKPPSSPSSIASDQSFDINAFLALRSLITPSLGASILPDRIRRSYTEALFHNSLLHTPEPGELPSSDTEILATLYKPRLGRTFDPPESKRSKTAYTCLETLFALVQQHDGAPERVRLAQAASPFLILRVGLTLRAYIADQPLRGLSPQPLSQRRELLYVLRMIKDLECEPRAIPEAEGVKSDARRHLHRLFPLVSGAIKVAGRDQELLELLGGVLDVVAGEMGVL